MLHNVALVLLLVRQGPIDLPLTLDVSLTCSAAAEGSCPAAWVQALTCWLAFFLPGTFGIEGGIC
jgi:hypothetical protein